MKWRWVQPILMLLTAGALVPAFSGCTGTVSQGAIVINEVVSSNHLSLTDATIGSPDWVELYNPADSDINLAGYHMTDNIRNIKKFTFDELILPAGGTCIVYLTDANGNETLDTPCTGFGLSRAGETLYLIDSYYGVIQQLEVPAMSSDVAYARRSDGSYGYTLATTPNAPNVDATIADDLAALLNLSQNSLRLSEIVPYPERGEAWVELYNASDEAVRLEDYCLSDNPAVPTRFELPDGTLEAGGYVVVHLGGDDPADGSLVANFRIGSTETAVYLSDAFGTVFDALSWEAGLYNNLAVVRSGESILYTAFPTPAAANSDTLFESAAPAAMDASDPLSINEVLPSNRYTNVDLDGDREEWAELYNGSDQAVELSGYYLSDDPDSPFKWALPERSLEPGGYCLVFLSGKDRVNESEIHASFGLSGSETELILTDAKSFRMDSFRLPSDCPEDVSVGRADDGSMVYYALPTPGYANATPFKTLSAITERAPSAVINEVFAGGVHGDDTLDWVELHNLSGQTLDLSGWYLSDSAYEPLKWRIESLSLPPDGYAVIYAASDETLLAESTAAFGIAATGEMLLLSDSDGSPIDRFLSGSLSPGISCGRADSSGLSRVFFETPTPGKENAASGARGYAPQPLFSETALYQSEAFQLELSCPDARAVIRYTLDGTKPNITSAVYEGGLSIGHNTVVRAAAFIDGYLMSDVVTRSYLFGSRHTVPVVCISGDEDDINIIKRTKFSDYDNKPESEVNISYYETAGSLGASFPAGLRAKGHKTLNYSHKAFTVHLRASYGQAAVTYPFFEDSDILQYSAFSLRGGGQDRGQARLRDSFFSRVADGLDLDNFRTRVVVVYINGAYYGLFDLNEQQNASYLAAHYGVDPDGVDIIRRNDEALHGTADDFLRVREYARTQDFSDDAVLEEFGQWVDVDCFAEYVIFQSYFANNDMFNQKYWRSADYTVRWRPILFDLDYGLHRNYWMKNVLVSYFTPRGIPAADRSLTNMDIYCALRQNAGWCQRFVERYVQLVYTYFTPERLLPMVDEMAAVYRAELPRHFEEMQTPGSMSFFESSVELLKTNIGRRAPLALQYLQKEFDLSDEELNALIARYDSGA